MKYERNGESRPTLRFRTTDAGPLQVVARNDDEVAAARFYGLNYGYEPERKDYGLGFQVNPNGTVSVVVKQDSALRIAAMSGLNYSIVR